MVYQHHVRVRYGETDQMGVVHHGAYVAYLEEARTEWLRELGHPYGALEKAGIGLPVRNLSIRYRAAAHYEDHLVVTIWVERLRAASITFGYTLRRVDEEATLAQAEVELACVSLAQRPLTAQALPAEIRAALEATQQ
jgi:acyl-CoA thioester hydrolase|tara:strand:- start:737 stop:1150 length:414 start_codon:yes stop_codon:yes gene_type:complete